MRNKPKPSETKTNPVSEFLKKHMRVVVIYNILIWGLFILAIFAFFSASNQVHTPEEMAQIVEERCENEVDLPKDSRFEVEFTTSRFTNLTYCEVRKIE